MALDWSLVAWFEESKGFPGNCVKTQTLLAGISFYNFISETSFNFSYQLITLEGMKDPHMTCSGEVVVNQVMMGEK